MILDAYQRLGSMSVTTIGWLRESNWQARRFFWTMRPDSAISKTVPWICLMFAHYGLTRYSKQQHSCLFHTLSLVQRSQGVKRSRNNSSSRGKQAYVVRCSCALLGIVQMHSQHTVRHVICIWLCTWKKNTVMSKETMIFQVRNKPAYGRIICGYHSHPQW